MKTLVINIFNTTDTFNFVIHNFVHTFNECGYERLQDYGIARRFNRTKDMFATNTLELHIYNEKMLQDPRIREMFLEHLI